MIEHVYGDILKSQYYITQKIGQGGMAIVYKAEDKVNHLVVAVKEMQMKPNLSPQEQDDMREAFRKEGEILEQLTKSSNSFHTFPNSIPKFYDRFNVNERCYIVMQYIEGTTLLQLIKKNHQKPLRESDVLKYSLQLCDALEYLHSQRAPVIVRDIKPENIMVDHNDNAYLIDFGIARYYTAGKQHDTFLFGSYGYAPPELVNVNIGRTEIRSDFYSLGATLHHCLTGMRPGTQGANIFAFQPISDYNPHVSDGLDNYVRKLLATNVEDRPTNIQEVKDTLRAIQNGQSINSVPTLYDPFIAETVRVYISWLPLNTMHGFLRGFAKAILLALAELRVALPMWGRSIGKWLHDVFLWLIAMIRLFGAWTVSLGGWLLIGMRYLFSASSPKSGGGGTKNNNNPYNQPPPTQPVVSPRLQPVKLVQAGILKIADRVVTWPMYVTFTIGLLLGVTTWSIGTLTLFHTSSHVVLFQNIALLFFIACFIYLKPVTTDSTRQLLAPVILGTMIAAMSLLVLSDMQYITRSSTLIQILVSLVRPILLTLAISSLVRAKDSLQWLDHIAITLLALWEAMLVSLLGPDAIHALFTQLQASLNAHTISDSVIHNTTLVFVGVLLVCAVVSLLFLRHTFSTIESFLLLVLAFPLLILQMFFGTQALALLSTGSFASRSTLNTVFLLFTVLITLRIIEWFCVRVVQSPGSPTKSGAPWYRLQRLTLLLLAVSAICLQQFVDTQQQILTQLNLPYMNMLVVPPFAVINQNMVLAIGLWLLLAFVVYGAMRRGKLLVLDCITLIGIGLACVLIEALPNGPQLLSGYEIGLHSLLNVVLKVAFLLFILSIFLGSLNAFGNRLIFQVISNLLGIMRRVFQWLCVVFLLLTLFDHIDQSTWASVWDCAACFITDGPVQAQHGMFYYVLAFMLLAAISIIALGSFLIGLITGRSIHTRAAMRPLIVFDWLDYTTMFFTTLALLALWYGAMPLRTSLLSLPSTTTWLELSTWQLSVPLGIASLLLIAALSLAWLQYAFLPTIRQMLRILLPIAFLCLCVAFTSILWTKLQAVFLPMTLLGLFLLMGGVFLAAQTAP